MAGEGVKLRRTHRLSGQAQDSVALQGAFQCLEIVFVEVWNPTVLSDAEPERSVFDEGGVEGNRSHREADGVGGRMFRGD